MEESNPVVSISEEDRKDLAKITRWFTAACDYEKTWRTRARQWHDYYHGDQLPADVLVMMKARNQPPIKFNLIKSIVNLLTGQEIQGRTDVQFVGTQEGSDSISAEILTDIYRQKNHEGYVQYEQTEAFQDGVIGGRGVIFEDYDEDEKKIVEEYVDWQEVFVDPCAKKKDYSDARHVFRVKWVDLDVALELFPEQESKLKSLSSQDSDTDVLGNRSEATTQKEEYFEDLFDDGRQFADPSRERVKIVECWWKTADSSSGVMNGIFTENMWLVQPVDFKRKHGEFPFVFTFYCRDRKGLPYGLVKDLIDPQDVINRSFSKSMHILGTRQILAEKDALPNIQKVQQEITKPDAIINDFETGALKDGRVRIEENRGDSAMAFQHFEIGMNAMNRISGVNPELQGLHTNARSGTAISMRMRQGNTVLTSLYDCLEKTKKKCAEKYIYLMSQFMTAKEILRYKLPTGDFKNLQINGQVERELKGKMVPVFENQVKDIFKYDIVITESAKSANANEHTLTILSEIIKSVPAISQNPLFISEFLLSTNLPNKEKLAQSLTGPAEQPGGNGQPTPRGQ